MSNSKNTENISLYAIDWQHSKEPWLFWEHVLTKGLEAGHPFMGCASHPDWRDEVTWRRKVDAPCFESIPPLLVGKVGYSDFLITVGRTPLNFKIKKTIVEVSEGSFQQLEVGTKLFVSGDWQHKSLQEKLRANIELQLRSALEAVVSVLDSSNNGESTNPAIVDTIWMPDGSPETLLDHCRAALDYTIYVDYK